MRWKKIIKGLENDDVYFKLNNPVDDISQISEELKVKLPLELIELYKETNGVNEYIKPHNIEIGYLIWDSERVLEENLTFRNTLDFKEMYMPFDHLFFFADAGNGDNFGYAIKNLEIRSNDIYCWDHENDSRNWVAPNLEIFIKWKCEGKL